MALKDLEDTLTGAVPWRTCAVCHHLSERDDAWGQSLRRLLGNRGVKFSDIAEALAADPDEPDIDRQTLSRHARGGCAARERLR